MTKNHLRTPVWFTQIMFAWCEETDWSAQSPELNQAPFGKNWNAPCEESLSPDISVPALLTERNLTPADVFLEEDLTS